MAGEGRHDWRGGVWGDMTGKGECGGHMTGEGECGGDMTGEGRHDCAGEGSVGRHDW